MGVKHVVRYRCACDQPVDIYHIQSEIAEYEYRHSFEAYHGALYLARVRGNSLGDTENQKWFVDTLLTRIADNIPDDNSQGCRDFWTNVLTQSRSLKW